MQTFGIDISHWQGNFNFAQAKKEGVKFAILKCGGADSGLYKDSKFERNYNEARKYGLGVGAYFFGYANTVAEAKKEAEYCAEILKGKKYDYPIFYDVEADRMNVGIDATTEIVKAFCNYLESKGYWSGFYTSLNWYNYKLKGAELARRFSLWLAWWTQSKPNVEGIQMWQFGGETNYVRSNIVAGQVCDQSYCYVDFPAMIKAAGKNGYEEEKPMTDAEKQAFEALQEEVKNLKSQLAALDERTREQYQTVKECPKWAKPTIKKLVDNGSLKGDGDGLGLTMDLTRTLVIVDRAGGFDK